MHEIPYIGNELEVFQFAKGWKSYFGSFLRPYLKGKVLEVGAGIGSTTKYLCNGKQSDWVCLEPDSKLYGELQRKIEGAELPDCCRAVKGITRDLPAGEKFDAILYIDVIEHIEKDKEELAFAQTILNDGGYLIVLVPAHQFLYSPFDKAIGHYRRYNKKMLQKIGPENLHLDWIKYLDSFGLLASVLNKYILKQDYPSVKQIIFWDNVMIRISKLTDLFVLYQFGKSLVSIWKKNK